jgi:hypothetical protein
MPHAVFSISQKAKRAAPEIAEGLFKRRTLGLKTG